MPIKVELLSPEGAVTERLLDPDSVLNRTLPNYDDTSFQLLSKIDWYGDTQFEAAQMALLLEELERIMPGAANAEQVNYLQHLMQIADRCRTTPGCKLLFLGD